MNLEVGAATIDTAAVSTPSPLETGLFARLRARFLGYDVFISYKRLDGLGYALALENLLRAHDYTCFRDYREIPAGAKFPAVISRALRRSRQLLVVGTPLAVDAVEGAWVKREIETYLEKRSRVIIVNIGKSVQSESWPALKGNSWIDETPDRLQPPLPSSHVLEQILSERRFFKVNAVARWIVALTVIFIAALGAAGGWYYYVSSRNAVILRAQELAASANSLRESRPFAIAESTRLALEAVRTHRSVLTEQSLRDSMAVLAPLKAEIRVRCDPQTSALDRSRRYLALASSTRVCMVDLVDRVSVATWELPSGNLLSGLVFLDDATVLVAAYQVGEASHLLSYSRNSKAPDWEMPLPGAITHLVRSPEGGWLGAGFSAGKFAIAQLHAGAKPAFGELHECPMSSRAADISLLEFASLAGWVLCGSKLGAGLWRLGEKSTLVWQVHLLNGDLPTLLDAPPAVFDSTGKFLAIGYRNAVQIVSLQDFTEKQSMPLVDVDALGVNSRGWLIVHAGSGHFAAWAEVQPNFQPLQLQTMRNQRLGNLTSDGRLNLSQDGNYAVAVQNVASTTASAASLIQIMTGAEVARLTHETYVKIFHSLGEGSAAVTAGADGRVRIWGDLPARESLTNHGRTEVSVAKIGIDDSGVFVAGMSYGYGAQTIERWQLSPPERLMSVAAPAQVNAIGGTGTVDGPIDLVVRNAWWVWRQPHSKPEQIATVPVNKRCGNVSAVARDARTVALSGERNEIWINDGEILRRLPLKIDSRCISTLSVSPDGRYLAASYVGRHAEVVVADLGNPGVLARFETQYLVRSLEFAPNAGLLVMAVGIKPASPSDKPRAGVEIRSLPDAELRVSRELPGEGIFEHVCVSDDGTLLATSSLGSVDFWNYDPSTSALTLRGTVRLPSSMRFCRFAADGKSAIVGTVSGFRTVLLDSDELQAEALVRLGAPKNALP